MKLTGELKDKVEAAETMEEKKNLILEAGIELTDEELDGVAGGLSVMSGTEFARSIQGRKPRTE